MIPSLARNIAFRLSHLRAFWAARARLRRIRHSFRASSFRIRSFSREERGNTAFLFQILRLTLLPVLLAGAVAVAVHVATPSTEDFFVSLLPGRSDSFPEADVYVTFLSTVAGIGGVLIGLYYAGVMTVASAVYSRMPTSVRGLLAHERTGNVYIRYLASVTCLSLILLSLTFLGLPPSKLAVFLVAFLAGTGVFAAMKLGQQAFFLFDPTVLSRPLFYDLLQQVRRVSAGGYGWADASFQDYAHRQARTSVTTLVALASLPDDTPGVDQQSRTQLAIEMVQFLTLYERLISTIPSRSRWYGQRPEYKDWYLTPDAEVDVARRTGITLAPKVEPDTFWLQDELIGSVRRRLETSLHSGNYRASVSILNSLEQYLQALSRRLAVDRALDLTDTVASLLFDHFAASESPTNDTRRWHLVLMDGLARLPITVLLTLSENCAHLTHSALRTRIAEVDWRKPESLYGQRLPPRLLTSLESLSTLFRFELQVEGKLLSPDWYRLELVARPLADRLVEQIASIGTRATELYEAWRRTLEGQEDVWAASAVLSRQWEYLSKLDRHLETVVGTWRSLWDARRIEGIIWQRLDESQEKKRLLDSRKRALTEMTRCGATLTLMERPSDWPDYGGQFLDQAGDGLFTAMLEADADLVSTCFSSYFLGCLKLFDSMKPQEDAIDFRAETDLLLASAPVLDLVDLSGYALLLSQLHHEPRLWTPVRELWDEYLGFSGPNRIEILAAVVRFTDGRFHIPHRGLLRDVWRRQIQHLASSLPRRHVRVGRSRFPVPIVEHKSPLVRLFARDEMGLHNDGINVFIGLYLLDKPEADGVDFGVRRTRLPDEIRQQEAWYAQHHDDAEESD